MWLGFSTLLFSAVSAAQLATATPDVSRFLAANRQFRQKTSNKARWHQVRLEDDKGNPIRPEVIGYIDSDIFNDFGC